MRKLSAFFAVVLMTGCPPENTITSLQPPSDLSGGGPLVEVTTTDSFVQTPTPAIDVLFVVDNSCSMSDEQALLSTNFPIFLDWFVGSGTDYQIGVVSTDMDDPSHRGRLRRAAGYTWIDEETANPSAVFGSMASLGIGGSGTEQGLAAMYTAIEVNPEGYNDGFRRPEASLMVVVISDEEDQSPVSTEEISQWLLGQSDDVSFSSIVSPSPSCDTDPGTRYVAVTQAVGGIFYSICEPDWQPLLDALGLDAVGLSRVFYLAALPVPGTIRVQVIDQGTTYEFEEDIEWDYDQTLNAIVFREYVPPSLSSVRITYDELGASEIVE